MSYKDAEFCKPCSIFTGYDEVYTLWKNEASPEDASSKLFFELIFCWERHSSSPSEEIVNL